MGPTELRLSYIAKLVWSGLEMRMSFASVKLADSVPRIMF